MAIWKIHNQPDTVKLNLKMLGGKNLNIVNAMITPNEKYLYLISEQNRLQIWNLTSRFKEEPIINEVSEPFLDSSPDF